MKGFIAVLVVVVLGGAATWWFAIRPGDSAAGKVHYRTGHADRGEVVEGIAASGAVQPVELVQVGTQISGTIEKLFVDFNSKVTATMTIALLDSRRLAAQVAQDEAAVARAKADVERMRAALGTARADIDRAKATVTQSLTEIDRVDALRVQAKAEMERQKSLLEKHLVAQADVDVSVANAGSLEAQRASADAAVAQNRAAQASAEASLAQDEAQILVGEASVKQSEAQLVGDRVNLGYATIVSPVDGVVVSRSVDVGQTVAASLSAPTLFLIARDLTKVHVEASVPEADVGRLHEKQPASFTVDAYPERTFPGVVSQVRLASTTVQNVVTYTVIVDASNPDGLLFPGMTANVTFEVARSPKDAQRVPAAALRLQPAADLLDSPPAPPPPSGAGSPAGQADGAPRARPPGGGAGSGGRVRRTRGTVYLPVPGNRLHAVAVRIGVSDGVLTVVDPVEAGSLPDGAEVVTAILKEEEPATTNPFAPPRMGGPRGGGR